MPPPDSYDEAMASGPSSASDARPPAVSDSEIGLPDPTRRSRFSEWVGRRPRPRPTGTRATPRELVQMVVRTARTEPGRVFLPAVVIFGLDAACSTFFSEITVDNLGAESAAAFAALLVSTLGLTFYAGLLERLVGAVERNHPAPPLGQVIRTLPYVRLLVADLILWVISGLASLAFIIPGLIVTTLFALIGPLINLEDLSIRAAFRRSATLVAPQFLLVLCLVTVPIGLEHELVEAIVLLEPQGARLAHLPDPSVHGHDAGRDDRFDGSLDGQPPGDRRPRPGTGDRGAATIGPTRTRRSPWMRRFTGRSCRCWNCRSSRASPSCPRSGSSAG